MSARNVAGEVILRRLTSNHAKIPAMQMVENCHAQREGNDEGDERTV
jgi:hypothetical protein